MNRLLQRSMLCAASTCILVGCGGEGVNDIARRSTGQLSLNGNWFAERQTAQGPVYNAETVISENGTSVLRTYCNRMTESLTREGSQLFDRNGRLHWLYVQDPISSGTLRVSNYTPSGITLSADLVTVTGMPVKLAANVRLQPR